MVFFNLVDSVIINISLLLAYYLRLKNIASMETMCKPRSNDLYSFENKSEESHNQYKLACQNH